MSRSSTFANPLLLPIRRTAAKVVAFANVRLDRMLWEFLQGHKELQAVYFVSGWDKQKERHIAGLLKGVTLQGSLMSSPFLSIWCSNLPLFAFLDVKSRFEPVMSFHVYALAQELPTDSGHLWQLDHELKTSLEREAAIAGRDGSPETYV